jgi:hypothetical protein
MFIFQVQQTDIIDSTESHLNINLWIIYPIYCALYSGIISAISALIVRARKMAQMYKLPVWVDAQKGFLPKNAVLGSNEGSSKVYVARAFHGNEILPAKFVCWNENKWAFVSYDGNEIEKTVFQVLCNPHNCELTWVSISNCLEMLMNKMLI